MGLDDRLLQLNSLNPQLDIGKKLQTKPQNYVL